MKLKKYEAYREKILTLRVTNNEGGTGKVFVDYSNPVECSASPMLI